MANKPCTKTKIAYCVRGESVKQQDVQILIQCLHDYTWQEELHNNTCSNTLHQEIQILIQFLHDSTWPEDKHVLNQQSKLNN